MPTQRNGYMTGSSVLVMAIQIDTAPNTREGEHVLYYLAPQGVILCLDLVHVARDEDDAIRCCAANERDHASDLVRIEGPCLLASVGSSKGDGRADDAHRGRLPQLLA